MKVKINKVFRCIILIMIFSLCSLKALAGENYVNDEARVLKPDIITKVNDNFAKLEKNTGAKIRIYTIKSLDGKNIDDIASKIAKDTSTDKNAVFVVAIKEHKNRFLVGKGLKSNFNSSDLERIVSLPNDSFKNNDFNAGILKVGKAIDEKITTAAVKEGKAVVKKEGNTKIIKPKESHTGSIIFVILLIIAVVCIVIYIKRRNQKAVNDFARKNNLNNYMSHDDKFKSGSFSEPDINNPSDSNSNRFNNGYSESNTSNNNYYREEPRVNNTTIINNGGGGSNDFVEGMIVNEMLHSHNDDRHEENRDHSKDNSNYEYHDNNSCDDNDDDDKLLSGDWGESGASSDWGSDSESNSDSSSSDW